MICGTGIDVVEISRLARSVERGGGPFLARLFTAAERDRAARSPDPIRHFALLFAAKEAIFKAVGLPFDAGFDWLDLDVDPGSNARRRPAVSTSGPTARVLGPERLLLSLGECRTHTVAMALRVPGPCGDAPAR